MPSAWITHVKNYASKNNINYSTALKDPKCSQSYKEIKEGSGIFDWFKKEKVYPEDSLLTDITVKGEDQNIKEINTNVNKIISKSKQQEYENEQYKRDPPLIDNNKINEIKNKIKNIESKIKEKFVQYNMFEKTIEDMKKNSGYGKVKNIRMERDKANDIYLAFVRDKEWKYKYNEYNNIQQKIANLKFEKENFMTMEINPLFKEQEELYKQIDNIKQGRGLKGLNPNKETEILKNSAWITHVKNYASKNNINYSAALKDPKCSQSYKMKVGSGIGSSADKPIPTISRPVIPNAEVYIDTIGTENINMLVATMDDIRLRVKDLLEVDTDNLDERNQIINEIYYLNGEFKNYYDELQTLVNFELENWVNLLADDRINILAQEVIMEEPDIVNDALAGMLTNMDNIIAERGRIRGRRY